MQGVAEIRAFSVAALQASLFACTYSRDPRLADLIPDLPDASAERPPSSPIGAVYCARVCQGVSMSLRDAWSNPRWTLHVCSSVQGLPCCLSDRRWLTQQLVLRWRDQVAKGQAGRKINANLALVTECFLIVAGDSSFGGADTLCPEQPVTQYLMFCWLGAVFTTMTQVRGMSAALHRVPTVTLST